MAHKPSKKQSINTKKNQNMATSNLKPLFVLPNELDRFKWSDTPFFVRDYYNYLLGNVVRRDAQLIADPKTKYYNKNLCLALTSYKYGDERISYCQDLNKSENPSLETCAPIFQFERKPFSVTGYDTNLSMNNLGMGAVIWLYYYEKMGIFKILGALMDDYNYKGKYTLQIRKEYSTLLEHTSTLYRMGIASNMRDRVCLYEKSLGLSVDNDFGMNVTRNEGFMKTFDGILKQALEHYSYRRLDNAIGSATGAARSSVATLTTIKDSLENLRNQFSSYYYGRNTTNTFLGIATVYATLCLIKLVKSEIGIPNQYVKPEEFIPAAYDILVMNKPAMNTDVNRFITYDNCATYGYRLLTDFELIDTDSFNPGSIETDPLNLWMNNIEPLVEGYKKAVDSIKD
jgi:hypothetical protein